MWFMLPLTCILYNTWLHPWQGVQVTCTPWPGIHLVPYLSNLLHPCLLLEGCLKWSLVSSAFLVRKGQSIGFLTMSTENFFSHLFIHFFFKFVSSVGLELVKSSYVNVLRLLETSSRTASQRSFLRWSQYLTLAQRSRSHGIFSFYLYLSYLQLGDCLCVPVGLYIVHECSSWSQPIFLETIFWWFPPCPVMRLIGRIEDPLCFSAPPQSSP